MESSKTEIANLHTVHGGKRKKAKGFTLIEILIVLAIGAGILFAVFMAVNAVQGKAVAKEASETLNLMVADTRARFRSVGNFSELGNDGSQILIDNNIPPRSMINSSEDAIISAWNTEIDVAEAQLNTPGDAVAFTYNDVNSDDCANFVQSAEGSFSRVTVNNAVVKEQHETLQIGALGSACSADSTVDIEFVQGR
ncbi:hypothetical protein TK90_2835 (plasmid) [Thioalkalivibrio sp. K90mix]|uniref:type 4 pilus major pilin n=1 Tax=Thioalkalivibrio sp. (strain K90mix) TaxID=396595 RepID=UPI000195A83B|nr:type II secretion system protein [Thioalkalivibrio sp. K90mix]ADC73320.1 hypothetical protein TK90_2835 [Thioalkalivibrio sp. K90mix]